MYDLSIINVLDDHNNYRSFPEWQEQTYLNKIIQDNWLNSDKICIDYYILNASQDFLNRMNLTYEEEKNLFKNFGTPSLEFHTIQCKKKFWRISYE